MLKKQKIFYLKLGYQSYPKLVFILFLQFAFRAKIVYSCKEFQMTFNIE